MIERLVTEKRHKQRGRPSKEEGKGTTSPSTDGKESDEDADINGEDEQDDDENSDEQQQELSEEESSKQKKKQKEIKGNIASQKVCQRRSQNVIIKNK